MNRHDERLAGVIGLICRLTAHITSENDLLDTRRPRDLADQIAEKSRLSTALGTEMAALRSEPGVLAEADPEQVGQLKTATGKLVAVLATHQRKLAAIRNVTEGIVRAIGAEIARENRAVDRYDENAMIGPVSKNWAIARPTALSLNQVV